MRWYRACPRTAENPTQSINPKLLAGDEKNYNYDTFDQIADNPDIDVVYIVLPKGMHVNTPESQSRDVLCEKPMANTASDCMAMKVIEAIGYRCQFEPHHRACSGDKKPEGDRCRLWLQDRGPQPVATQGRSGRWRGDGGLAGVDLAGEEPIEISEETKTDPVKFAEVDESIV